MYSFWRHPETGRRLEEDDESRRIEARSPAMPERNAESW